MRMGKVKGIILNGLPSKKRKSIREIGGNIDEQLIEKLYRKLTFKLPVY